VSSNHHNPQPTDLGTATPAPDATSGTEEHWWPRLVDRINDWWIHREPTAPALRDMLRIPPAPATATILATITAAASIAAAALWWIVTTLVGVLTAIGSAIAGTGRTAAHTGAHHVAAWSLTRTITDPVHAYLTTHATGLPLPAHLAWWTWLATTGGLFVAATLGSRGARIGWTLTGALTVAMVYTATPHPGHTVAAGLTVTAWSLLSIAALNRATTHPIDLAIIPHRPTPAVPAPDDTAA